MSIGRGQTVENKRPNILFIMTDHQRADSLGMVQDGTEVTPRLNRLAAQGTVFTRAYTTCPLCVPARTALATGKYPTENGVVFNDWQGLRAGDHSPVHQFLFEAGYDVGHIGVHHIRVAPPLQDRVPFSKWSGNREYSKFLFQCGMEEPSGDLQRFKKEVTDRQDGRVVKAHYSNTKTAVWPHPEEYFMDSYFCQQAIDFIVQKKDKLFALFVYLWAPHPPLRVPEPYASRFDPARLELPPNVDVTAEGEPCGRRRGVPAQLAANVSMDQWRKVWAAHLGLVNLVDAGIGRILEALDASGQTDNTLVIFTVDHGDHLGQHRMYQKMEMYEQAIRVPLLCKGPGVKSQVFDTPVSHLDLLPTLLEYADMGIPDDVADASKAVDVSKLDGISLRECLERGTSPPERAVFCQYSGNAAIGDLRRAVISKRYKYIYDPADRPELYDLEADPLEMHNMASSYEGESIVHGLHKEGKAWARSHNDWILF